MMILLTGANGVVGQPMAEHLQAVGAVMQSVSRKPSEQQLQWNLHHNPSLATLEALSGCTQLIHCAPIWLLPAHLEKLYALGIRRMVVFSSSSVISKQHSAEPQEQELVVLLETAEQDIQKFCEQTEMRFTIFRPSLIYGRCLDENITHIANFIKKRGFMLLAGQAKGLRQPVQADDLVTAALTVIDHPNTVNKIYTLAGAEQLSYRAMVERIFVGLQKTPRVISVPLWLFRLALKTASLLGSFNYTAQMANRMNQDLAYSNQAAMDDFGYDPQPFLSQPERDLP